MSIRCTSTPLGESTLHVAYDEPHSQMATHSPGHVSVWEREAPSREWVLTATLALEPGCEVTCLGWAGPRYGPVLAAGTSSGSILVWDGAPLEGGWVLRASLRWSPSPVTALAFAPHGVLPQLAASYGDGHVRFFQGSHTLSAERWEPCNSVAVARDQSDAATCLSWRMPERGDDEGLPPLLAVGTSCSGTHILMYRAQLLRWEMCGVLVRGRGEW